MSRRPAVTRARGGFLEWDGHRTLTVTPGVPARAALEQASSILRCVDCLAMNFADEGIRGSDIFALQYLAEMARALVDASAEGLADMEGANGKASR